MAYGIEAVSPAEISLSSPRVETFSPEGSIEGLKFHDGLIEEIRNDATSRVKLQQQRTTTYFNKKIKAKLFAVGELVLREAAVSHPTTTGKLKAT